MRSTARERSRYVRLSAGRGRTVRQLLTEVVIALAGSGARTLLGVGGVRVLVACLPPGSALREFGWTRVLVPTL